MFGKTKSLFLIVASMLCMASCDSIREDLPRCELWLEFVFDYNMEYADAFNPQVKSVDVLVFDSDDKLLFTKSAEVAALVGGSRRCCHSLCFSCSCCAPVSAINPSKSWKYADTSSTKQAIQHIVHFQQNK